MSDNQIFCIKKDDSFLEIKMYSKKSLQIRVWDYETADIYITKAEVKKLIKALNSWVFKKEPVDGK